MPQFQHRHIPYSKITDYIYIGTNECCLVKGFIKELLKIGIKADISLEEIRIDAPFGVKYYLWLPVKDHTAPIPLQFKIGVAMIDQLVKAKKKIYIHCEKGHGRAPTLVTAYLMTKGMEPEEAIKFLKSKRTGVYIHPKQMVSLRQFKKSLFMKNKKDVNQKSKYYKCSECGLEYEEKEWAKKCEDWCKKHKSCNLEIIQHAVRNWNKTNL